MLSAKYICRAALAFSMSLAICTAKAGTLTTLHAFTDVNDGAVPENGLTYTNGLLYGTTNAGGLIKCGKYGCGTIFSIDPATGVETILFSLNKTLDGPSSKLLPVRSDLYGSMSFNRQSNDGSIFDFNLPSSNLAILSKFPKNSSSYPQGDLVFSKNRIYGATLEGGQTHHGTLYSVDASTSKLRTLHVFKNNHSDGIYPGTGIALINDALYGTAGGGGPTNNGTLFEYDLTSSTYKILHSFSGSDGSGPSSPVVSDGSYLYGTTSGVSGKLGTVYKFDPTSGQLSTLYTFEGDTEGSPYGSIIIEGNFIYGTTGAGGAPGAGTIYKVDVTTGTETVLYTFTGGQDGQYVNDGLVYEGGAFFGTTRYGGTVARACPAGCGTVFKFVP